MFRQGKLYNKSVHIGIFIQFTYLRQKFIFRYIGLKTNQTRLEPAYFTSLYLGCHVSLATAVMTNQYSSQMRTLAALSHYFSHFGCYFLLHLLRNSLSVNQCHILYLFYYSITIQTKIGKIEQTACFFPCFYGRYFPKYTFINIRQAEITKKLLTLYP